MEKKYRRSIPVNADITDPEITASLAVLTRIS